MNQNFIVILLVKGDNLGEEEKLGVKNNFGVLSLISWEDNWVTRENY